MSHRYSPTSDQILGGRRMDDIEIWRSAEQMRKLYEADAFIVAALRADKLMDEGDIEGFEVWKRIAAAVDDLDRTNPRPGEAVN
jgi:hypothetical protein